MKNIKPHFVFSKQQRSGVFLLVVIILVTQCFYFFYDFNVDKFVVDEESCIASFQDELDSLYVHKKTKRDTIYPFNPNYISDYKGYVLGLDLLELDRLHSYRASGRFVNSAREFQSVTKVSDSLIVLISPYFKFPDWVAVKTSGSSYKVGFQKDLNLATANDIQKAIFIDFKLASRVVNYRNSIGGFLTLNQLVDVYGISDNIVQKMKLKFVLNSYPAIKKININFASASELSELIYISDYVAANIVSERLLREGFSDLDELRFVQGFPSEKLERIKLYLTIN